VAAFSQRGQPRILHIALEEALLFEHFADACSDLLHQCLQLGCSGCRHVPNTGDAPATGRYTPSGKIMWKWLFRFSAEPKRWISVTAPG
jgi:UDP-N-acetyl-D-mannosaminuronic acid transferase (WecB/TagA/CpsF family)